MWDTLLNSGSTWIIRQSSGLPVYHGAQKPSQHLRDVCRISDEERAAWEVSLDPVQHTGRGNWEIGRQHRVWQERMGWSLPRRLRVLADAYQRRLDFRMTVHRAPEVLLRDAVLPEIRVRQRDDVVVVCAPIREQAS